jgi:hypothetical protein
VWYLYICIYLHAYQGHDDRADPEPAQESVGRPSEVCERERGREGVGEGEEREREGLVRFFSRVQLQRVSAKFIA